MNLKYIYCIYVTNIEMDIELRPSAVVSKSPLIRFDAKRE